MTDRLKTKTISRQLNLYITNLLWQLLFEGNVIAAGGQKFKNIKIKNIHSHARPVAAKYEELEGNTIPFQNNWYTVRKKKKKKKTPEFIIFKHAVLLAKCSQVQNIFYIMCCTR